MPPSLTGGLPWGDWLSRGGISGACVNGTCPSDWDAVEALCTDPSLFPSFGLHPWFVSEAGSVETCIDQLVKKLSQQTGPVGIGEIGLDGWKDPSSVPAQIPFFLEQLHLAREGGYAVTIHCLKAWDVLRNVLHEFMLPDRFYFHAFSGSSGDADYWIRRGAYFGFSSAFAAPRYHRLHEIFRCLPRDRILLETDAPSMPPPLQRQVARLPGDPERGESNHPYNLTVALAELAQILEIPSQVLDRLSRDNFMRFFKFS